MRSATSSTSSSSSSAGNARLAQPSSHRLDARDRVAGEHHLHGRAHAEEPGVEVHVGHAEAHRRVAHLGVLGHVDEVAAGGELAAAGQAVAVHLGDDRLGQVPDAHPALGDVARPLALAAGACSAACRGPRCRRRGRSRPRTTGPAPRMIVTRTSGSSSAAWSASMQVAAQRVVQRVALLGPVQGDAPHPRRGVVDDDQRGSAAVDGLGAGRRVARAVVARGGGAHLIAL